MRQELYQYTLMPTHIRRGSRPRSCAPPRSPRRSTSPRGRRCCATRPCPAPSARRCRTVRASPISAPCCSTSCTTRGRKARCGMRASRRGSGPGSAPSSRRTTRRPSSWRATGFSPRFEHHEPRRPTRPSDRPFPRHPTSVTISLPKTRRPDLSSSPDAEELANGRCKNELSAEHQACRPGRCARPADGGRECRGRGRGGDDQALVQGRSLGPAAHRQHRRRGRAAQCRAQGRGLRYDGQGRGVREPGHGLRSGRPRHAQGVFRRSGPRCLRRRARMGRRVREFRLRHEPGGVRRGQSVGLCRRHPGALGSDQV